MERLEAKVALIGAGAMGGSIARGLVASGALSPSDVAAFDPSEACRASLGACGIHAVGGMDELLAFPADVVVVAVKPQILASVIRPVSDDLAGRLVVSIAAGVTIAALEELMPASHVIRVMPNLPIQVLSGATAIAPGTRVDEREVGLVRKLFSALGSAQVMREDQLDAEGAVVSCGPAYIALFVDALTRAGVRAGLPAAACREMLLATMTGVASQLAEEGVHPRAYMERVTSPGGTTSAGLFALEPLLVQGAYAAVDAALDRTAELAGGD